MSCMSCMYYVSVCCVFVNSSCKCTKSNYNVGKILRSLHSLLLICGSCCRFYPRREVAHILVLLRSLVVCVVMYKFLANLSLQIFKYSQFSVQIYWESRGKPTQFTYYSKHRILFMQEVSLNGKYLSKDLRDILSSMDDGKVTGPIRRLWYHQPFNSLEQTGRLVWVYWEGTLIGLNLTWLADVRW